MRTFTLEETLRLPLSPEELFPFFTDVHNLEAITPPWLHFRVLRSSTKDIQLGTEIDYALRVHGIPLRWRSLISEWNPPYSFVDEQVRGPYRKWHHRHTFEPDGNGGTYARDRVEYAPLGGAFMNHIFVRRDLDRIFAFRQAKLVELFTKRRVLEPLASAVEA